MTDLLLQARARVLHDLAARGLDTAAIVSVVDEVMSERAWWVQAWPAGEVYLACLVAQDVQEVLLDQARVERWPQCLVDHSGKDLPAGGAPHALRVDPDLGEDPHWVCEEAGVVVASVGALGAV